MGADVGGADTTKSEPNVVPLCDILLVLLIIFMVVTPMIQKGANVSLPDAQFTDDQPKPGEMITVFVKEDGTVLVTGAASVPVEDITKLPQILQDQIEEKGQEDKTKVLLSASKDVDYGKIVDVMDEIKNAEIEIIGLVASKVSK